ncbi:uncharacterized protein AB9W97_015772 isoform 1-T1 [Spinachia spinachia]
MRFLFHSPPQYPVLKQALPRVLIQALLQVLKGRHEPSGEQYSKPNGESRRQEHECGPLLGETSNGTVLGFSSCPLHRLHKMSQIFFVLLCAAVEISSLVLFCQDDPIKVPLVALLSVAIGIHFTELVIVCLPIGPSHELWDLTSSPFS